ncbi:MAG: thioredoxin-disulfide reductase [Candidatus Bathyarchaeota archaeon]|nr:thioredoxin-disulfide reductase [Candidatus Bathyarchaeota archaeon]
MERWDLVIIGAGPAGLTAGIYGARSGLKTLVLEEKLSGGLATDSPWIENYPGFPEGVTGSDLAEKMLNQCRRFGAEIREFESVVDLSLDGERKVVKTEKSECEAGAVIVASGSRHKKLEVPGEEDFQGRGVSYCAVCDGFFFKEKRVLVVGGGNTAAMSALYLGNLASEVYLAHRRDRLRAEEVYAKELTTRGVRFLWNIEVKEIRGDSTVKSVVLFNNKTGENKDMNVDGVFICIGEAPNSGFARKAGIAVDEKGFILTDVLQRTYISGVYAAGDVTSCPVKQIGTAVGQAIVAATEAFGYIKQPYYYTRRHT